ncbi:hypothetical protein A2125_01780 [Candidatus Woesebacteria bacterium GWB1_43_5]|uniref:TrpR like protein, YerC/YecD n=1 Tax=Candidatus Woesebacteria bacterium GWB1_43_5 TaxID=1802474 RepID=A0A1F7WQW8_9BACT|nr:MAG: hypothetical protein A2125_01780 [Candidatus Woesebacteria bacterium GWB1_43_5]
MTQVSRSPLNSDVWERIFNLFVETLTDIKDKKKLAGFIDDFFSPTERIMFAKRLAAAVLLTKGHDYISIRKVLKVSPPTIAKMNLKLKYAGVGLNTVIKDILNKQAQRVFWKELEDLIDFSGKQIYSSERFKRKRSLQREVSRIKHTF